MLPNDTLLEMVKEITVARISNSTATMGKTSGENVADFMEPIYKKLVELNKNEDSDGFPKGSTD